MMIQDLMQMTVEYQCLYCTYHNINISSSSSSSSYTIRHIMSLDLVVSVSLHHISGISTARRHRKTQFFQSAFSTPQRPARQCALILFRFRRYINLLLTYLVSLTLATIVIYTVKSLRLCTWPLACVLVWPRLRGPWPGRVQVQYVSK